jgi:hypothetical protein
MGRGRVHALQYYVPKDRTHTWQGGKQGKIGIALGTLLDGVVELGHRV